MRHDLAYAPGFGMLRLYSAGFIVPTPFRVAVVATLQRADPQSVLYIRVFARGFNPLSDQFVSI